MGLINVTDTYQAEILNSAPAHKPIYPLQPPVDLIDAEVYSRNNGYTHDAYDKMRSEAPIMWHPEQAEFGAGFWTLTSYALVKQVELDPATYSSQKGGILMNYGTEDAGRHPLLHSASLNSMINLDRPYHTT